MTYSVGGLIQASDFNAFAGDSSTGINRVYGAGSADYGYGQSPELSSVSASATVTATNWASLVSVISTVASHQGTSITARTQPVTGDVIAILSAVATDITNCTTNRGNATASGSEFTGWSGTSSKTTATGSGSAAWTITFTHTITWGSAAAARYFFNCGGRIKWAVNKSSTGTDADEEWNDLASTLCGAIYITGGTATQTIAGSSYTGTTQSGGTGTPSTLATTTGFHDLITSDTVLYKQFADTFPYTGQYIQLAAKTAGSGTQLVLTTTWYDPGNAGTGYANSDISGGTALSGVTFGTAPATLVTFFYPSSTYIADTWGSETVVAGVA